MNKITAIETKKGNRINEDKEERLVRITAEETMTEMFPFRH